MYSGTLDVKRTAECAECRHPLMDHTVSMKGATESELQFCAAREGDGS
jgi:ribosomal protein L32